MRARRLIALGVAALGGCQAAGQNGALEPSAGKGLVIMAVAGVSNEDALTLTPFNEAERQITWDHVFGTPSLEFASLSDKGVVWRQIDPGTYVFSIFGHQGHWGLCFGAQSLSFTIQPGQKLLLGTFDVTPFDRALSADVVAHHDTLVRGQESHSYFENVPVVTSDVQSPAIGPGGMLSVSSTQTIAGVEKAVLRPASFKTGHTLFGERTCGGYGRQ